MKSTDLLSVVMISIGICAAFVIVISFIHQRQERQTLRRLHPEMFVAPIPGPLPAPGETWTRRVHYNPFESGWTTNQVLATNMGYVQYRSAIGPDIWFTQSMEIRVFTQSVVNIQQKQK